jgi:hypothetical protein
LQEEFEDTKGVMRICISKDRKTQWPKEKVQKELKVLLDAAVLH